MILQTSDFESGIFQISQDQNTVVDLQAFITLDSEKALIYELFGSTLGQEFINDLTGEPQTPASTKWTDIFSPFYYDDPCDISITCQGIKEYLKGRIYYNYVSQQQIINQASGNVANQSEATSQESLITKLTVLYNRTIRTGTDLQYYIYENQATYTDFRGLVLEPISAI